MHTHFFISEKTYGKVIMDAIPMLLPPVPEYLQIDMTSAINNYFSTIRILTYITKNIGKGRNGCNTDVATTDSRISQDR